jgi:hypothetical protein
MTLLRQADFIVPCQSGHWLGEVVNASFQHNDHPAVCWQSGLSSIM